MSPTPPSEEDYKLLQGSTFLDPDWYLETYPDVAEADADPIHHYLNHGYLEGRNPSVLFKTDTYLNYRPDIREAGLNPLVHFLRYGIHELSDSLEAAGVLLEAPEPVKLTESVPALEPEVFDASQTYAPVPSVVAPPLIVFVTHDMEIGGAPVLVNVIGDWFRRHTQYEVRFVSMGGGDLRPRFEAVAPTHTVGAITVSEDDVPDMRDKVKAFLGREPALTFVNSVVAGDYLKINPYNTPVIAYIHEMKKILEAFPSQMEQILQKATHIFCGGHTVYETLTSEYGVSAERLSSRPSFVPVYPARGVVAAAEKTKLRRSLKLPVDRKLVVGCGIAHWRKQPDVFVSMAAELITNRGRDYSFVWVGEGEDLSALQARVAELGLGDHVHLVGHRQDYDRYLAAADVFALTSVEDPFPLVSLEAGIVGTPSVVFREATGLTQLVEPAGQAPAGLAVPLGDEAAYFDAVDGLLIDDERRLAYGQTAHGRVLNCFTDNRACQEILVKIRELTGIKPRVSIVLPNYNCGPYLLERLDSITRQTFRDVEILLLDDKSSDGSEQYLIDFAADCPVAKLMLATENGGSVFAAWERGITAATGDLIWITEADDSCAPDFLERVLRAFRAPGVRLVHGRSIPVNEQGEVLGDWNDLYLDRISPGRWRQSYSGPAAREVNAALGCGNTIPNASGAVVLRESAQRAVKVTRGFKLAGDWAYYLVAAAGGRMAYVHEAVNYHRRHTTNVTKSIEGSPLYFTELADVGAIVRHLYGPNAERDARFQTFLEQEAQRFGRTDPLPEARLPAALAGERPIGLLYGVGDLSEGGAQMFAIRMANRWVSMPAPVVILSTGNGPIVPTSMAHLSPEIPIVRSEDIMAVGLPQFMRDWGLDVIASGHWWADRLIGYFQELASESVPWSIIMHGCYENVLNNPQAFPDYETDFARAQEYADCWVWTAEKNRAVFQQGLIKPRREVNISNGFDAVTPSTFATRSYFGLPEDAVIFTLASRAIETKGWFAAAEAFRRVRDANRGRRDVRLLLIGNGPAADELSVAEDMDGVHMISHTSKLADYIAVSDVCLLPSWFPGESLPLVLIEFLAQGKPAIVSDIGMCAWAVDARTKRGGAGFVLPRDGADGTVDPARIAEAMQAFVDDPELVHRFEPASRRAFKKFNMNFMVARYRQLFDEVV